MGESSTTSLFAVASRGGIGNTLRAVKVIGAPWFKIIDGKGAFETPSAKLIRNRRLHVDYLGHAQADEEGRIKSA
jgi:hypothetical protein